MKTFLQESLKKWHEIGAAFPCTQKTVEHGLSLADLEKADTVVEYGCGTGVFTKEIQSKLKDNQVFFALELNKELIKEARVNSPKSFIYNDSAENVCKYLQEHGREQSDVIISTLPWAIFSEPLQKKILDATYEALPDNGEFVTIAYNMGTMTSAAKRFRKLLDSYFSTVKKSSTVWKNMPPAFFYYCKK